MKREQVFEFFRRLAEANPSPTTELDYTNPYTLLVAVVLSAQATDASVNIATKPLFGRIKTPQQMVELGEDRSEEHTSELQSRGHLVCRLLLEKKKTK